MHIIILKWYVKHNEYVNIFFLSVLSVAHNYATTASKLDNSYFNY